MSNDELKQKLLKVASRECWSDDPGFMNYIDDYAGGNVDDAYYGGTEDGQAQLARELLNELFGIVVPE